MSLKKEIENINSVLFNILVPGQGNSKTLEGELLRAANRIAYRWYNDGDMVHTGYGIETAGSAWIFLNRYCDEVRSILFKLAAEENNLKYGQSVDNLVEMVLEIIKDRISKGNMKSGSYDCLDYFSEAKEKFGDPDEDYDDDYYDDYDDY